VVSWRAAWCKVHEPAIFMAAVLANWGGYYGQRVYLTEVRRLGLALHPPHINHARREFSVSYLGGQPVLFMGLDQVRDLTRRTQMRILGERPFRSLDDFLARVDPRPIEAENLIQAGALEGFGSIPSLLRQAGAGSWQGGQLPLFDMQTWGLAGEVEDWSLAEKMAAQNAVLGVSVIAHPLDLAAEAIRKAGAINTVEAAARIGQRARVAGVRQMWRRSAGEHGEIIYLMSFEDLEGMLEVLIPGSVYRRYQNEISGDIPFLVEGEILLNPSIGEPFIRAERLARLVS
jgi:error-prone DNA polymerase